jgi:potassium channel subfamily K
VWSLMAVPTVTILISNVGDILVGWVRGGLMLGMGDPTALPKRVKKTGKEGQPSKADGDKDDVERMGSDVGHLGQAVEHAEEERGRGGGLSARLAREVSRLAQDAANKPGIEYAWEDWAHWLTLLGERTDVEKGGDSRSSGDSVHSQEKRGEWTWLGDEGPLFSGLSETQWILGKLCERLEEVLKEEISGSPRTGE